MRGTVITVKRCMSDDMPDAAVQRLHGGAIWHSSDAELLDLTAHACSRMLAALLPVGTRLSSVSRRVEKSPGQAKSMRTHFGNAR